jgi:formylglycine-generating enzyme required for sulfatase activity/tRNA A-37 threonylcarbamoyl transferase component Bud32
LGAFGAPGSPALTLPEFAEAFSNLPRAGETLVGYQLLDYIGRGAQGEVWQARSLDSGAIVALKLYFRPGRQELDLEETYNRLRAVLERTKVVEHPNLVAIIDFGRNRDVYWIAQEYVATERNLHSALIEWAASPTPPAGRFETAARWALGIARALEALHAARVLHGDLKPANVLLDDQGQPKVTDLGLARILRDGDGARSTSLGFAGTTLYAAPEVLLELEPRNDVRSDIYSLGVVLYELCALARPVRGLNLRDAARGRLIEPPPPPRANDGVPEPLARIAMRCLEPEPRWRYATATALAEDLERFLAGQPLQAPVVTKLLRFRRKLSSEMHKPAGRRLVVLVVLGLLLLVWRTQVRDAQALQQQELQHLLEAALEQPAAVGLQARVEHIASLRAGLAKLQAHAHLADPETLQPLLSVGPGASAERRPLWDLNQRLAVAEAAEAMYEHGGGREAWRAVDRRLADDPRFAPWLPTVLPELFPLGPDASSGLEEFWLVTSGTRPGRDANGRLAPAPGEGLVLVLLPGGSHVHGVPLAADLHLACFEAINSLPWDRRALLDSPASAPAQVVSIEPFFFSKWELTQDQYQRLAGTNPSHFAAGKNFDGHWSGWHPVTGLHPVEQVSAQAAERLLALFGLELPSETRFEYALRAGCRSRWPEGESVAALLAQPGLNLLDPAAQRAWPTASFGGIALDCALYECCDWTTAAALGPVADGPASAAPYDPARPVYDDCYAAHGPVHLWSANAFGLVGLQGNVAEWCADDFCEFNHLDALSQEAWRHPGFAQRRAVRGGSFLSAPDKLSCHARDACPPDQPDKTIGIRPMLRATIRPGPRPVHAPEVFPQPEDPDAEWRLKPSDMPQRIRETLRSQ